MRFAVIFVGGSTDVFHEPVSLDLAPKCGVHSHAMPGTQLVWREKVALNVGARPCRRCWPTATDFLQYVRSAAVAA